MKYFLVVGEASGDLHASNLMAALKKHDADADFCFFGGDLMQKQGGRLIKHYRELAFMGLVPVLLNLRTILKNMKVCEKEIVAYQPDVLVLVDYPGFNLKIAKFIKQKTKIPVYYYISPKVWAWKEHRVKSFKKYVDKMFCILPFEVEYFRKHNYKVNYVGNPTVDAIADYKEKHKDDSLAIFREENKLPNKPIIALLAGSRKQEIKDNLPDMLESIKHLTDHTAVIAGAPGIEAAYYTQFIKEGSSIVFEQTYRVLSHASLALVTSGTATLETALFRVPQVVCYKTVAPTITYWIFKNILTTKYISLVNLIADKTVVQEFFSKFFSIESIRKELDKLLNDESYKDEMLAEYDKVIDLLGNRGASDRAAQEIIGSLKKA